MRMMNWPASGGSTRWSAWGSTTRRMIFHRESPMLAPASIWARGIDWIPARTISVT